MPKWWLGLSEELKEEITILERGVKAKDLEEVGETHCEHGQEEKGLFSVIALRIKKSWKVWDTLGFSVSDMILEVAAGLRSRVAELQAEEAHLRFSFLSLVLFSIRKNKWLKLKHQSKGK